MVDYYEYVDVNEDRKQEFKQYGLEYLKNDISNKITSLDDTRIIRDFMDHQSDKKAEQLIKDGTYFIQKQKEMEVKFNQTFGSKEVVWEDEENIAALNDHADKFDKEKETVVING